MNLIKENRMGRFSITKSLLKEGNPFTIMQLMGKMIIVNAVYNKEKDVFEYCAYSKLFDSVVEGAIIPNYEIEVTQKILANRRKTLKFKAIK